VAEKSERKQLEKKYSKTAEELKAVTSVSPEQPIINSAASCVLASRIRGVYSKSSIAIRSTSSYLEPLPHRIPPRGTLRPSRPPLERSQSDLCTSESKQSTVRSAHRTPRSVAGNSAGDQIRRNDSSNDFTTKYTYHDIAPLPELRGFGKHRMAVDADPDHQMIHLQRTMSDLTDQMVNQLGNFDDSGISPECWSQYQKLRTESAASSASSRSNSASTLPRQYVDPKRGCTVVRGFTPSIISSTSSSTEDEGSSQYRKDSSLSMTSLSSDGEPRNRRRKSRQASLPISDKSATSPLTTITENPDVPCKSPRKMERACQFNADGNTDSAVASDCSDEGAWMPEIKAIEKNSQLTKQIDRNKKPSDYAQPVTRTRTQSTEEPKPRVANKPAIDRSRTVKHSMRPSFRRVHSHKRSKSTKVVKNAKTDEEPKQQESSDMLVASEALPAPSSTPPAPAGATSGGSEEAKENPTDLGQYMEKVRSKRSSKAQGIKTRESDDDGASVKSTSTAKTVVPMVHKIFDSLPLHRRQRSATAFKITESTCQPPTKAQGARPESSQATAH
jgi:hypothetical protein